jgi:hypothetical protein
MTRHKPWQPRMRNEPLFNPFQPSTDWTREIGANDRVEIPEEEERDEGMNGGDPLAK